MRDNLSFSVAPTPPPPTHTHTPFIHPNVHTSSSVIWGLGFGAISGAKGVDVGWDCSVSFWCDLGNAISLVAPAYTRAWMHSHTHTHTHTSTHTHTHTHTHAHTCACLHTDVCAYIIYTHTCTPNANEYSVENFIPGLIIAHCVCVCVCVRTRAHACGWVGVRACVSSLSLSLSLPPSHLLPFFLGININQRGDGASNCQCYCQLAWIFPHEEM